VSVAESQKTKHPVRRWFVTFQPSNPDRMADIGDREQAARIQRADREGAGYLYVENEDAIRPTFYCYNPESQETYVVFDGDPRTTPPRTVTETVRISWFTTAGEFSNETTGVEKPDTTLKLDKHQPAAGATIDLPGVGENFQDHLVATQCWESKVPTINTIGPIGAAIALGSLIARGQGPLTTTPFGPKSIVNIRAPCNRPAVGSRSSRLRFSKCDPALPALR